VVTFDDGTADFVDNALEVLVAHHIPATLYLATSFVEDGRSFWDDGTVLSWPALRDALSTGLVSVGTHTHTHALLDRADATAATEELETSIGLVEDRLGVSPAHFAYPKAVAPPKGSAVDLAVRSRVRSAAVAGGRVNRVDATDVWRLARTPIVAADDLDAFERKARGGLRLEGEARERLDRLRYRRAAR
jgi:peptidoglycan/xylan/chitin deacetylase (PgdA/CDA1 family)